MIRSVVTLSLALLPGFAAAAPNVGTSLPTRVLEPAPPVAPTPWTAADFALSAGAGALGALTTSGLLLGMLDEGGGSFSSSVPDDEHGGDGYSRSGDDSFHLDGGRVLLATTLAVGTPLASGAGAQFAASRCGHQSSFGAPALGATLGGLAGLFIAKDVGARMDGSLLPLAAFSLVSGLGAAAGAYLSSAPSTGNEPTPTLTFQPPSASLVFGPDGKVGGAMVSLSGMSF